MAMYELGYVHTLDGEVASLPQTEYLNADSGVDACSKLYHRHGQESIRLLCVAEVVVRNVVELGDFMAFACPLRETLSAVSMTEAEAA